MIVLTLFERSSTRKLPRAPLALERCHYPVIGSGNTLNTFRHCTTPSVTSITQNGITCSLKNVSLPCPGVRGPKTTRGNNWRRLPFEVTRVSGNAEDHAGLSHPRNDTTNHQSLSGNGTQAPGQLKLNNPVGGHITWRINQQPCFSLNVEARTEKSTLPK